MSGKPCFVYVVACVQRGEPCAPIKFGLSDSPLVRLRELQTGSAHKLALCAMVMLPSRAEAQAVEASLHMTFADRRMSGEWFDMLPLTAATAVVTDTLAHLCEAGAWTMTLVPQDASAPTPQLAPREFHS